MCGGWVSGNCGVCLCVRGVGCGCGCVCWGVCACGVCHFAIWIRVVMGDFDLGQFNHNRIEQPWWMVSLANNFKKKVNELIMILLLMWLNQKVMMKLMYRMNIMRSAYIYKILINYASMNYTFIFIVVITIPCFIQNKFMLGKYIT